MRRVFSRFFYASFYGTNPINSVLEPPKNTLHLDMPSAVIQFLPLALITHLRCASSAEPPASGALKRGSDGGSQRIHVSHAAVYLVSPIAMKRNDLALRFIEFSLHCDLRKAFSDVASPRPSCPRSRCLLGFPDTYEGNNFLVGFIECSLIVPWYKTHSDQGSPQLRVTKPLFAYYSRQT